MLSRAKHFIAKCTVLCLEIVINVIRASCEIRKINVSPQINIWSRWWCHEFHSNWVSSFHLTLLLSHESVPFNRLCAQSLCPVLLRSRYFLCYYFSLFGCMIIFAPIIYISCAGFDCELEKEFFLGIDSVSIFYTFYARWKFLPKEMHVSPFIWTNRSFSFPFSLSFYRLCLAHRSFSFFFIIFYARHTNTCIDSLITKHWLMFWLDFGFFFSFTVDEPLCAIPSISILNWIHHQNSLLLLLLSLPTDFIS